MSNPEGHAHPGATAPIIDYSRADGNGAHDIKFLSITGSRLAVLLGRHHNTYLIVWDWRNNKRLVVRESLP